LDDLDKEVFTYKAHEELKYLALIFLVIVIFVLSYIRHSYILNFNCHGEPQVVGIGSVEDIHALDSIKSAKNTVPFKQRLYSTFLFWILFFILHSAVIYVFVPNDKAFIIHIILFLFLSALSAFILGLNLYLIDRNELYSFASRIKNFLLSPVYTFVTAIFVKYVMGMTNSE